MGIGTAAMALGGLAMVLLLAFGAASRRRR